MAWTLFQALLSLLAVLGLMVGVLFLMKKYLGGGQSSHADLIDVDVVGYKVLQPKRAVYVVKVLNRAFVIGSSEDGLHSLGEIDGAEIDAVLKLRGTTFEEAGQGGQRKKSFVEHLYENMGLKRK
jgi:flagellar biogenesis protein FliO